MTDHAPGSRVELDGRRVVVDLSDADRDRLTTMAARSGVSGPELVLGWIRRGLLGPARDGRARDWPADLGAQQARDVEADRGARRAHDVEAERGARRARDVDVARQADEAFRGLLGGPDHTD
ncbi:hypothetical protein [Promicromonospora sp. NPDC050880]|uniref:hypothetical protein n=1 Tax=Promicromonospora sp. NPDC050880 TaxID=3364406 RepID=UPI0037AE2ED5